MEILLITFLKYLYCRSLLQQMSTILLSVGSISWFFVSSFNSLDDRINMEGYNFLRADHHKGNKRGGACMYFKQQLPILRRDDLCNLPECLVTEIRMGKRKWFFTCLYRSSTQSCDDFDTYLILMIQILLFKL